MDITLRHLEVLHAIVVSGSISNAKRSLGLSQPTISQQLAKLEELLDAQLIRRTRGNSIQLTQAGEYWCRVAQNILGLMNQAEAGHRANGGKSNLELHFGTTPSLRGQFMEQAARLACDIDRFSRVNFSWATNSDELVEMITTHQLNCAILSLASVEPIRASLNIIELFTDKIVLVVPRSISEDKLSRTLNGDGTAAETERALLKYVAVGPGAPWFAQTEQWYRSIMPHSEPFFRCMTHQAAVDIVAAGLATCHAPLSLLPNLPASVYERIRVYDLKQYVRKVVLVMPKHLLTLKPFADFQNRLGDWVKGRYSMQGLRAEVRPLPMAGVEAAE